MSRRRIDRGKVTRRAITGEAGRWIAEAAADLGYLAQIFGVEMVGPHLSADRLSGMLRLGDAGYPIVIEIRLNRPKSIRLLAAGVELFRADVEVLQ